MRGIFHTLFRPNVQRMKDRGDITGLIKALRHKQSNIRRSAAESLGQLDDRQAIKPLIGALCDKDRATQMAVLNGLALHRIRKRNKVASKPTDREADANLGQRVTTQPSGGEASTFSLRSILDEASIKKLDQLLDEGKVSATAVKQLDPLAEEEMVNDLIIESLVDNLADEDRSIRQTAADALIKKGSLATNRLIDLLALKDLPPYTTKAAIRILGEMHDPRAVEPLVTFLSGSSTDLRLCAAEALSKIDSPAVDRAVDLLVKNIILRFRDTVDYRVKSSCLKSLGGIHNEEAIDFLIEALDSKISHIKIAAIEALGTTATEEAIDLLIEALDSKNTQVKLAAIEALRRIGTRRAIDPLVELFISAYTYASTSYHQLGSPLAQALAEIGNPAIGQVASALMRKEEPHSVVRTLIGQGLAHSEPIIENILRRRGDREMAFDLLNCGNNELAKATEKWAKAKGYSIVFKPMGSAVKWGIKKR